MRLVLAVVGENAGPLGRDGRKVFGPEGGSLGRGGSSAWRLPDPTNTLSSNHAVIAHNGLGFTITDTSTNGVYINTVEAPLGRGNTAPLADGDTLYLADYVIAVSVEHDQAEQRQKLGLGSAAVRASAASRREELGAASLDLEKPFEDVFGRNDRFGFPAAPPPRPALPPAQSALPDSRFAGLPGLNEPWPPSPPPGFGPLDSPATSRALGTPGWPDAFPLPGARPDNRPPSPQSMIPDFQPLDRQPLPNGPLLSAAPEPGPALPLPGKVIPDDLDFSDLLSGLPRGAAPQERGPLSAPAPLMPAPAPAPISPLAPPPVPPAASQPIPNDFLAAPAAPFPAAVPPIPEHVLGVPAPLQRPAGPPAVPVPPPVEARAPVPSRPPPPLSPSLANDLVALRDPGSAAPLPGDRVLDPLAVLKQRAAERGAPAPRGAGRDPTVMGAALPPGPALPSGPAMPGGGGDRGDLNAFWDALGVDPQSIAPERRHQVLTELGCALREMAEGLHSVLAARTMLKGEFQVEQTRIQSNGNNAFKFLRSGDEALRKTMASESGFLSLSRAVRDGFHDIKAHEVAAMMAMRAVIGNVLTRVSPPAIENEDTTSGLFGRRTDKTKLWDRFVELHASMVNDIDRTTRTFIGEEFSRTYDEQVAKLRRGEG